MWGQILVSNIRASDDISLRCVFVPSGSSFGCDETITKINMIAVNTVIKALLHGVVVLINTLLPMFRVVDASSSISHLTTRVSPCRCLLQGICALMICLILWQSGSNDLATSSSGHSGGILDLKHCWIQVR